MAARRGGYPYRGSTGPLAGGTLGSKAAAQVELAASQSCSVKRVARVARAMYYDATTLRRYDATTLRLMVLALNLALASQRRK